MHVYTTLKLRTIHLEPRRKRTNTHMHVVSCMKFKHRTSRHLHEIISWFFCASTRMETYAMGPWLVFSFRRPTLKCLQPSGGLQAPPRLHRWSRLHLPRNPRRMKRTSTCVHLERPTFMPFVSGVTTIPIACWNSTSGICLLQGGPYHLYRFPPAMVVEDTKVPENARDGATGSGDGGSGSTAQVGGPIPLPVCL